MDRSALKRKSVRLKSQGGKQIGAGCQARIDPALGCGNKCVGCYAKRVSYLGKEFDTPYVREIKESTIRTTIKKGAIDKGITVARCGMQCDPGSHPESLKVIMDISTEMGLRLIVATKSLPFNESIAHDMVKGKHILQVSLGMISEVAPSDFERYTMGKAYEEAGVETVFRVVDDVTKAPLKAYQNLKHEKKVLITPMRFTTTDIMKLYKADVKNYTHVQGYYRPDFVHIKWLALSKNICGIVGGKEYCSNCLACAKAKNKVKAVA